MAPRAFSTAWAALAADTLNDSCDLWPLTVTVNLFIFGLREFHVEDRDIVPVLVNAEDAVKSIL
jgi:hypothetical protein